MNNPINKVSAAEVSAESSSESTTKPTVIIVCHAWFYEQIGGSFKIATEQAIFLAKQGYQVCYVCSSRLPDAEKATPQQPFVYEEQGVKIWAYPAPKAKSPSIANIQAHIQSSRKMVQAICKNARVEAIIGHSPLQFFGASGELSKHGIRGVYSVHSPFDEELKSHWKKLSFVHRIAIWMAHWLESRNLKNANLVQTYSHFTKNHLIASHGKWLKNKTEVSSGYVDCDNFQPLQNRLEERMPWGQPWASQVPTFFTVRRLEPRMGIDTLVRAAEILRKNNHDFRILIGGAGSQRDALEQLATQLNVANHVQFLGRLSDEDVVRGFSGSDCFVLPTKSLECFGLIILEAFACNTPVIGTTTGAIPELVNLQGEGWSVPPDSPEQFAQKMAAFLTHDLAPTQNLRELAEQYNKPAALKRLCDLHLS